MVANISLYQLMDKYKLKAEDIEVLINKGSELGDVKRTVELSKIMKELDVDSDYLKIILECYSSISLVLASMSTIKARAIRLSDDEFQKHFVTWYEEIIQLRKERKEAINN